MLKVFIADDEEIVREGLKNIIDWNALDFMICGEASNGINTLEGILNLQPDLVLLDIRMPKLHGLDVASQARSAGFIGKIIILSGYSDFKYAQDAIRCGVDYYFTKPIDEEELYEAVSSIGTILRKKQLESTALLHYRKNAKYKILRDIILASNEESASAILSNYSIDELNLNADSYRIVLLDGYQAEDTEYFTTFCSLLKVSPTESKVMEHIQVRQRDVVLLMGKSIILRFDELIKKMIENPSSPAYSSIFISSGRTIGQITMLPFSYSDALNLLDRRFFCKNQQRVLLFNDLPDYEKLTYRLNDSESLTYNNLFYQYIQTFNRKAIEETLSTLQENLFYSVEDSNSIKAFLSGLFLNLKHLVIQNYVDQKISFAPNSEIIDLIQNKRFLYEVIQYFIEQFDLIIKSVGNSSSESIIDDILYYIDHNYQSQLKLDTLAPIFGYNSSYLGKVFFKRVGVNFNTYLDQIRINKAKELLLQEQLKVYAVSKKVGYSNVDYFHKKFKKHVGISPAEYRSQHNIEGEIE